MMDERLSVLIYHIREPVCRAWIDYEPVHDRRHRNTMQSEHPAFVASLPEVPWKDIRGLRNRIAHGYFEVDADIVWRAAVEEVPALARVLVDRLDPPQIGS